MKDVDLVISRILGQAGIGSWPHVDFESLVAREGLRGVFADDWATSATGLAKAEEFKLGEVLLHVWAYQRDHMLLKREQAYIKLDLEGNTLSCMVATPEANKNAVLKIVLKIKELFPPEIKLPDGKVWLTLWVNDAAHGPQSLRRKIVVPSWKEVGNNYPSTTNEGLGSLMNGFRPATGGQLLLWHGVPGTGKTYALRALAREWDSWCRFEYVTDPEEFFGKASYMMSVLMRLGNDESAGTPSVAGKEMKEEDKWTLLVLEDTGELLSLDAKQRTGQGLSRFLNLADGIIGQGLKVMALVTTNEPIQEMHPAVGRPGRCAAEVEFKLFDEDGALEWLSARVTGGVDRFVRERRAERSLAELYSLLVNGKGPATGTTAHKGIGFRTGGG